MANSLESGSEDPNGSRSLAAVDASPTPFGAAEQAGAVKRPLLTRLLDYSAHAAIIVGLVGFAWTVSSHVVSKPSSAPAQIADASAPPAPAPAPSVPAPAASAASAPNTAKDDQIAQLRRSNKDLGDELHKLRNTVSALQTALKDDKRGTDLRALQAGLDNVQTNLASARTDLNSKLDKIEREPNAKLQKLDERLGKLEKGGLDQMQTASIPTPPAKPVPDRTAPTRLASLNDGRGPADKPILPGYVVRDVYDGVAIVEGRRGPVEVVPGVSLPGAGIVKSIDRHGAGWTVTTTKGVLAYAAPTRESRRAYTMPRPYYPEYREDF